MRIELSILVAISLAGAADAAPRRRAVIVGANGAAPGRGQLRYAHQDAEGVAAVLSEVGGFERENVTVLLDPEPAEVLRALDAQLRAQAEDEESMLLFYYSGHADQRALYPKGLALSMEEIRVRLTDPRAKVRVGIIDACRGGGWTGAKGLQPIEPFEVSLPDRIGNEGFVLIASSSGDETAHEAEVIGGSFFTHHLTAGLRGAADDDQNGAVSLAEVYTYAQRLTVRDAAIYSKEPQHPSYRVELKGRQDLTLAQLAQGQSQVELVQSHGPLEIIHVESGTTVLEVPEGERRLRLALRPGSYLVRRRDAAGAHVTEIVLAAGQRLEVAEADLTLRGAGELALKATERSTHLRSTVERGGGQVQIAGGRLVDPSGSALGFEGLTFAGGIAFGITDRLQVRAPALFAYRFGADDGHHLIPWAGVSGIGLDLSAPRSFRLSVGAGADVVVRIDDQQRFYFGLYGRSFGLWGSSVEEEHTFDTWRATFSLGYSFSLFDIVTLGAGVAIGYDVLQEGRAKNPFDDPSAMGRIGIGSVIGVAERPIPLVSVHVSDWASLDGYAAIEWFADGRSEETYLLGTTFSW